eukprot:m.233969 g.233969  ORF g.233969 m.233969 type:complete len:260 (-) comp12594_c0_seq1:167-946(-)
MMAISADQIPPLKHDKDDRDDLFELSGTRIAPLSMRRASTAGTARSPGVTPHATTFFKTTVLPDGRTISNYHVSGVDGEPGRRGSFSDDARPPSWGSTARVDFTERLYIRPEDRPSTTRYGNASQPWVTAKLRHREIGIVPNSRARTDHFNRDRHPRPATTPAGLAVWDGTDAELEPLSPPPIGGPAAASPPSLPAANGASTARLGDVPDLEGDVKGILAAADPTALITSWMQSASLFEREVARRFLHDVAAKAAKARK